jgi:pimeloyl-ACP methyl ester carboxylesterase
MRIIIISHGWTGFRNLHSDLAELFASNGFLVASVDHTYGSVGRLVLNHIVALNQGIKDTNIGIDFGQGDDITIFKERLNLEQIGVIGHSTGGGGVVKLALTDDRVKVVIGYDPWVEPIGTQMLEKGLKQEAMFFRSTSWVGGINEAFIKILALNESASLRIYEIEGSKHQDFTMLYQFGPIPEWIGISGALGGQASADIIQDFSLQFMEKYLLDKPSDIDTLDAEYDDVFEVIHRKY